MTKFEIAFLADYSDAALLDEIRRVSALLPEGDALTHVVFKKLSPRVSTSTIRRRFGGWLQALHRAGVAHRYGGQPVSDKMREQPARQFTNDELLAEMRRVHALVGKSWLSSTEFSRHSVTSAGKIRARFGSFRRGLEAAGIPAVPVKQRQYSDQECLENLAAVWTHSGRAPTYREMFAPPSAINGKTYVLRWGTWRKALATFVDWANREVATPSFPASGPITEPTISVTPLRSEADTREIRPGLRFKVFLRDGFRCVVCGRSPATHLGIVLHADHKLAVAKGGKTTLDNLQTLCEDCNLGKGQS